MIAAWDHLNIAARTFDYDYMLNAWSIRDGFVDCDL
jgi:hypothetical protein